MKKFEYQVEKVTGHCFCGYKVGDIIRCEGMNTPDVPFCGGAYMALFPIQVNTTADNVTPTTEPEAEQFALVKTIGKTTYRVRVHFSTTSKETMSDKIMRMLKNEIQQM